VHETQTGFNASSAFFGRVTARKFLAPAAILVLIGGVSVLGFKALRLWSGSNTDDSTVKRPSNNIKTNLNPPSSLAKTNKGSSNQRSINKAARTEIAISKAFNPKSLVAGAAALRTHPQQVPTISTARGSPALFGPDDKKKTRKSILRVANTATRGAIRDKESANPIVARKEPGKTPSPELGPAKDRKSTRLNSSH